MAIHPVSHFSSTLDQKPLGDDVLSGKSQLLFEGTLLPFQVPAGQVFKQFQVGDLYLVICSYSAIGYENFSLNVLNQNLRLLSTYVSPNLFEDSFTLQDQFEIHDENRLRFRLRMNESWVIEILDQPRVLAQEAIRRVSRGWWAQYEIPKLFARSYISVR